jgi:hypothetical protein
MKKQNILLLSLVTVVLVNYGADLNAAETAPEKTVNCGKAKGKITIDGDLKDWAKAEPAYVTKSDSYVEKGKVKDDSDLSVAFYTLYDEENIYFAAVVTDDEVVTRQKDGAIWQDDCIEIWLDNADDSTTPIMFADDDYQIGLSPQSGGRRSAESYVWHNPDADLVMKEIKVSSTLTDKGYIIEASIPIKVLYELDPKSQKVIGFNISVCDLDKDGVWTHITWSGKLHSDPTQFGKLYFAE